MGIQSLRGFVESNFQRVDADEMFDLENDFLLKINLNGEVWTKMGAMVAYTGKIHLTRQSLLRQGFRLLKKAISKQGVELTKAKGTGQLFLADQGKKISLLYLENQSLFVHSPNVLAFERSIDWDISATKSLTGALVGGLFHVRLGGTGVIAISTRLSPVVLQVGKGMPVYTDPRNTVAWSGNLHPELKVDVSVGTLMGRSSGDTVQMKFEGDGFVVVQAVEEMH